MSSHCKLPSLPAPACPGQAAHSHTCLPVDLDVCPEQDMQPCPVQTFQLGPCPYQGTGSCLDDCPQVVPSCPPPAVPLPLPRVTTCPCPAPTSSDPPQSKGGTNFCLPTTLLVESCTSETAGNCVETFPFQHPISPVNPCLPETDGTCMENIPLQFPILPTEPCALEIVEISTEDPCGAQGVTMSDPYPNQHSATCLEPCPPQGVICTEPRASQSVPAPMGTCTPQGTVEICTPQGTSGPMETCSTKAPATGVPSPRGPFRLDTHTAAIVERCLSRCQKWLRDMK